MTDELKSEIAKARATYDDGRGALSDLRHGERPLMSIPARPKHDADLLISDSLDLVPRLLSALELAIEQRDDARASVHTQIKAQNNSRATERNVRALYDAAFVDEDAAILAALRGEDGVSDKPQLLEVRNKFGELCIARDGISVLTEGDPCDEVLIHGIARAWNAIALAGITPAALAADSDCVAKLVEAARSVGGQEIIFEGSPHVVCTPEVVGGLESALRACGIEVGP